MRQLNKQLAELASVEKPLTVAWRSVLLSARCFSSPPLKGYLEPDKSCSDLVAGRVMLAMRLLDFFRMGFRWGFGGGSLVAFAFTHLR